ncbi:hypothetical protein NDU88_002877 [Pleurodeles waltl]|uniref:Uncharacterized protein n=1 Tax=Pleurodeles waltl TaxID=8319 RepID=A0AAV7NEX6_PLEWA|nr:hypothetical protein NDU88_002877 [Pleurodeles waltl]
MRLVCVCAAIDGLTVQNTILIPAHALTKRKILPGSQKSNYLNRDKTGGVEEKALLSRNLEEEDKIGTGKQLTFRRNPEKDNEHQLLGGAGFILGAKPKMVVVQPARICSLLQTTTKTIENEAAQL